MTPAKWAARFGHAGVAQRLAAAEQQKQQIQPTGSRPGLGLGPLAMSQIKSEARAVDVPRECNDDEDRDIVVAAGCEKSARV